MSGREPQRLYWRSLEELADTPEAREMLAREFPEGASELPDDFSRRRFLQIIAATAALAGASGCRFKKDSLAPHNDRPEGHVPGETKSYATALELGGVGLPLLATSYDGRPIKIEGNDLHPASGGATNVLAQAAILDLYDPDRSRRVLHNGERPVDDKQKDENGHELDADDKQKDEKGHELDAAGAWQAFEKAQTDVFGALRKKAGAGLTVVHEATSSPSFARLKAMMKVSFPQGRWFEYEPISRDNERAGTKLAFGAPHRPLLSLDQADTIVCLDEDLLAAHPDAVRLARQFADRRDPDVKPPAGQEVMARLYAIESVFSTTGAMADHRLPVRSEQVLPLLKALEAEVYGSGGVAKPPGYKDEADKGAFLTEAKAFIAALATELTARKGRSVIAAGARQPAAVHARVARLNTALGNVGRTVRYVEEQPREMSHADAIAAAVADTKAIDTLLILGGNPVYDAPADVEFRKKLDALTTQAGKTVIHLSHYVNETSVALEGEGKTADTWHLPRAHFLESWGDCRAWDGSILVHQPLIEPLLGGRSELELLALLLGEDAAPREIVRETAASASGGSLSDDAWRRIVHDGFLAGSASKPVAPALQAIPNAAVGAGALGKAASDKFEVVFCADTKVYDGRFANNAWLQELPDFITKLTWENAALISPYDAKQLGIRNGDEIVISLDSVHIGQQESTFAYVLPGQARGSITIPLGYGRAAAGHVGGLLSDGVKPVGFNAYRERKRKAMDFAGGAGVNRGDGHTEFAMTQDHFQIGDRAGREGRDEKVKENVQEVGSLDAYLHPHKEDAGHGGHHPVAPLFGPRAYDKGYQWGMSIDLNRCIGCNACVVACQAENNIPVVGRRQVARGREMHWLRIDRYFRGDEDDPEVVHQPVMCFHCENAPCEQVCPVAATTHSEDGLNEMVYNRCIGTRYCSNNCPVKVRRFNFFNYHRDVDYNEHPVTVEASHLHMRGEPADPGHTEIKKLMFNPEVTIRHRGVMEKCSFCVQRIEKAKIDAKNRQTDERRATGNVQREVRVLDGEVQTACQQACPARAIVFGDLNGRRADGFESEVATWHARGRSYTMLDELDLRPRLAYLKRVRNPNLPKSKKA